MSKNDIVKDLAMGSIFTGQISEAHIVNMKAYPFIFIDGVESAEISYDIVTDFFTAMPGKKSVVSYKIQFIDNKSPENLAEAVKNLQKALTTLFSQNITVVVTDRHGQTVAESDGK